MKFYRARFEASSFTFEGFAHTKEQAIKVLRKAVNLHTKQYELEKDWYTEDDFNVDEFQFGVPYRDYDSMEGE